MFVVPWSIAEVPGAARITEVGRITEFVPSARSLRANLQALVGIRGRRQRGKLTIPRKRTDRLETAMRRSAAARPPDDPLDDPIDDDIDDPPPRPVPRSPTPPMPKVPPRPLDWPPGEGADLPKGR